MNRPPSKLETLFGLHDKVVLLTGATGGIGRATAGLFAEAGAVIALTDKEDHACAELAAELAMGGCRALSLPCELRDPRAVGDLVARTQSAFGRIDVLIANAGMSGAPGPMSEMSPDAYDDLFMVNLRQAAQLCMLTASGMAQRRDGAIVLTSSIAGMRGNKALGVYGMTKAALSQLARNLAVEYGPHNVRANALAPGLIATSWASAILSDPASAERRLGLTPLRRIGQPVEVASAALFLASAAGAFITGQTLVIDGGTLISDGG
jgi:NAD(P)-dependent dehydrogenase (short-subunit alcohol dehydrogenase family)